MRVGSISSRPDYDANDLRLAADGFDAPQTVARMRAIARVYDGEEVKDVARDIGIESRADKPSPISLVIGLRPWFPARRQRCSCRVEGTNTL